MAKILKPEIVGSVHRIKKPYILTEASEEDNTRSAGKPSSDRKDFYIFFDQNRKLRAMTP